MGSSCGHASGVPDRCAGRSPRTNGSGARWLVARCSPGPSTGTRSTSTSAACGPAAGTGIASRLMAKPARWDAREPLPIRPPISGGCVSPSPPASTTSTAITGYRHMADEDLDLVVHLGDYIYEHAAGGYPAPGGNVRHHEGGETVTLDDYRRRLAQYRRDPDLQAAHAAFPFVVTWDDHEVDNNYPSVRRQRRSTGYRCTGGWTSAVSLVSTFWTPASTAPTSPAATGSDLTARDDASLPPPCWALFRNGGSWRGCAERRPVGMSSLNRSSWPSSTSRPARATGSRSTAGTATYPPGNACLRGWRAYLTPTRSS